VRLGARFRDVAALFLLPVGLAAQETGARFSGYLEHQTSTSRREGRWTLLDYDRVRVNLDAKAGRGATGAVGVIYQLYRGETRIPLASALPAALAPLAGTMSVVLDDRHFLNHAYVTLGSGALQITAGKQYLTWGAAYAFNPTELFRPKNLFEPGYDREGVGAASAKVALGPLSEVLVALVPNGGFATSGKVARARHHLGGFDLSVLAAQLHESPARSTPTGPAPPLERRVTLGGDLTGEVLGLGVWAEGTWSDHAGVRWVEATVGSNYTLGDGTLVMVEGYFDGRGRSSDPYPVESWLGRVFGGRRSLGEFVLYGLVSRPVHALWTVGVAGLRNLGDQSMVLIPSVAYSFAQNVDLLFNGLVALGRDGTEYWNRRPRGISAGAGLLLRAPGDRFQRFAAGRYLTRPKRFTEVALPIAPPVVGLAAVAAFLGAAGPAVAFQAGSRAAALDSLIAGTMRAQRIPGVAVAVIEDGKPVFARAYGIANLETGTALDTSSVFELASVTKQFTAAAIMLLVEEGKVRLDDSIPKYLPGSPEKWAGISVRHLLTHTSGLPIDAIVDFQGSALLRITAAQALEHVSRLPLIFPPGEGAFYSDAGYFLLGLVIEKASGQTYREFMRHRIFEPAGMSATSILDRTRVLKGRVATYRLENDELVNWRRDWDYEVPSFFGVFSTLADLAKWDRALRRASLVSRKSLDLMWTPARLNNGQPALVYDQLYGLGWVLGDVAGHRTVGHGGASGTYFLRFVDRPITVALLTNRGVNRRSPMRLAEAVAGTLYPELRPAHLGEPTTDPDPALAGKVATLIADLGSKRESPVTSPAYRAWYATASPPWRSFVAGQLTQLGPPRYLATATVGGRSLWGAEPLDRLVYYSLARADGLGYLTIGVTQDGSIGRVDFTPW